MNYFHKNQSDLLRSLRQVDTTKRLILLPPRRNLKEKRADFQGLFGPPSLVVGGIYPQKSHAHAPCGVGGIWTF